ncbi:hypothetical protein [Desulfurobacterium sp.]|uniref:hypothetical protein n=1 Tax=Desulfurobacterium sp. TaxID=2004706 RepID=UPI0026020A91|nr:hypothetical protein [Desulfurobacterium sp.]
MKKLALAGLLAVFMLSGCMTEINKTPVIISKNTTCAVMPFVNYSETPLAGESAASITFGVLKAKGYKVSKAFDLKEEDLNSTEIKKLEQQLKTSGYTCAIGGYVNEWRYKTGIDGEPAVSVTIYVENLKTENVTSTLTVSGTSWGHKSIGVLYQELLNGEF